MVVRVASRPAVRLVVLLAAALPGAAAFAAGVDSTWKWRVSGWWSDPALWSDGVSNGVDAVARLTMPTARYAEVLVDSGLPGGSVVLGSLILHGVDTKGMSILTSGVPLVFDVSTGTALLRGSMVQDIYGTQRSVGIRPDIVLRDSLVVDLADHAWVVLQGRIGEDSPGQGIAKIGPGVLALGVADADNTYSGPTVVTEGILACTERGLSPNSNLVLQGGLFSISGLTSEQWLVRNLGTGPGEVQWTGSGGSRRLRTSITG